MSLEQEYTVELFCGTAKPFSNIADALGYPTFTFDLDAEVGAKLTGDVRTVAADQFPQAPLVVWSAPPCHAFMNASEWQGWEPKTEAARLAEELMGNGVSLITKLKPKWWFIETPKSSVLRKLPLMAGFNRGYPTRNRYTIDHRQFGGEEKRESDIWTNAFWWRPEAGDWSKHDSASSDPLGPTYSATRRRVPAYVYAHMLSQLDEYSKC